MVAAETTILIVNGELAGAQAWAGRHSVPLTWVPERLWLLAQLVQPETNETFYLRAQVDDYRVVAPAWTFTDAAWSAEPTPYLFPRPGHTPYGSSLFHPSAVICAPFNRLAYAEYRGPHGDWGGPASWLTAGRSTEVKAHYLGDMLQLINRDFVYSRGRLG